MWIVKHKSERNRRTLAVIHINTIVQKAHLLPVYRQNTLPENFHFSLSLDVFRAYFVNSYVNYHVNEFLVVS